MNGGVNMWINIPDLSRKCKNFIKKNPQLKMSKFVCRNGKFVFYRKNTDMQNMTYESSEFRIYLVADKKGVEGWTVDYMRHTGKWQSLPIFGSFDDCLEEIQNNKWGVFNPLE